MSGFRNLSVQVEEEVYIALRNVSRKADMPISETLRKAIHALLERQSSNKEDKQP